MTPEDTPKSLADPAEIVRRRAMLTSAHMKPLAAYTRRLRARPELGAIPDFDPCDGGVNAQVLFLFEKPSAKAFDSGFISRNNNDQTAVHTLQFMRESGIPRNLTCTWNIVPGWNGTMKITASELQTGHDCLADLVRTLPDLKAAVLVGRKAETARTTLETLGLKVVRSMHPSPLNRASQPEAWAQIGKSWQEALAHIISA